MQPPIPAAAWPTSTFIGDDKKLFFNGEGIHIIHQPAAHTDGDSIVFFRRSDVISTGDIFTTTNYPVIDLAAGGTINGIIDGLNTIIDLIIPVYGQEGGTLVIPGHGRLSDMGDVINYREMATIVRDRVQDMIKKGHDARAGQGGQAHARLRSALWIDDRSLDDRHVRRGGVQNTDAEDMTRTLLSFTFAFCFLPFTFAHAAQGRGASATKSPKDAAPIDLTGYWVSIVSEDWRFRMVTAPKGDYPDVPLNAEGKKIADSWDPAKDEASADHCQAYGAPNIMRVPGRLHITWADDTTLKIETDAGRQTRLLTFNAPAPSAGRPQRQGYSAAQWEGRGALKVATTGLLPGYLQSNGAPYSGKTVMTEHFDLVQESNGDQWLIVDAIVEDPQYLIRSFIRSTHFRKQPDASGWDPTPCLVR